MKPTLTVLAAMAAVAFAAAATATTATAQVVVAPAVIYPAPTSPALVCEVRREQITDERGWRVRDVVVCFPR
jgi:hypothetical protein